MDIDINLFSKYFLVYLALIFSFILFGFNNIPISQFNIIIIIITVLFCCLIFFYVVKNRNEEDLHKIAFIVIITFGVLFVVLSPINSGYDEPEHFTRAEITSQGVLLPNYEWEGENPLFYKSSSLEPAIHVENNVSKGYKTISSITSAPRGLTIFDTNWDDEKINHSITYYDSAFVQNPFFAYIAQALGVFLAKLFDLNNIWMLWLGRFFNILVYATICSFAIKKSPVLKMPMLVISCLPFAVVLSSTMNTDALNLSLSLLVISYFLYLYKSPKRSIKKRNIAIFIFIVLILSLSKVTLLAFSLLLLAIPQENFENKNYYYLSIIGIISLILIILGFNKFYSVDSLYNSWRGRTFIERHVNATEQLSFIFHNYNGILTILRIPTQIPDVLLKITRIYTFSPPFDYLSIIYTIFLVFMVLFYPINVKFDKITKIISLIIIISIFFGTYIIQYLTWAPVGSTDLSDFGISTRYFIPFFTLLPVVFNLNKDIKKDRLNLIIIMFVLSFLSGILVYILSLFY